MEKQITTNEFKIISRNILDEIHQTNEKIASELENSRRIEKAFHLMLNCDWTDGETRKKRIVSVTIDSSSCSNCGKCVHVCPQKVLSFRKTAFLKKNKVFVRNQSACIGCLRCMTSCKQQAIEVIRYQ